MFWQYSQLRKHLAFGPRSFIAFSRFRNTSTLWFIFTKYQSDLEPEQINRPPNSKLLKQRLGTRQKIFSYPLPQHLPIRFNDHSSILSLLTISNKSIPVCSSHKQRVHHPVISSNFAFQPNFLLPKKQKSRAESAITLSLNKSNRSPTIRTFPVFLTHQLLSSWVVHARFSIAVFFAKLKFHRVIDYSTFKIRNSNEIFAR